MKVEISTFIELIDLIFDKFEIKRDYYHETKVTVIMRYNKNIFEIQNKDNSLGHIIINKNDSFIELTSKQVETYKYLLDLYMDNDKFPPAHKSDILCLN